MASVLDLLRRLTEQNVDFVLVGGMASAAHGSSVVTEDVDVCIHFDRKTLVGVLAALKGLHPRQRMHPARPPLSEDPSTYENWKSPYVVSDAGQIDFLGEISGTGRLDALKKNAVAIDLGGFHCFVMGLDDLIQSKKALGRPKDLRVAAELELIHEKLG